MHPHHQYRYLMTNSIMLSADNVNRCNTHKASPRSSTTTTPSPPRKRRKRKAVMRRCADVVYGLANVWSAVGIIAAIEYN